MDYFRAIGEESRKRRGHDFEGGAGAESIEEKGIEPERDESQEGFERGSVESVRRGQMSHSASVGSSRGQAWEGKFRTGLARKSGISVQLVEVCVDMGDSQECVRIPFERQQQSVFRERSVHATARGVNALKGNANNNTQQQYNLPCGRCR